VALAPRAVKSLFRALDLVLEGLEAVEVFRREPRAAVGGGDAFARKGLPARCKGLFGSGDRVSRGNDLSICLVAHRAAHGQTLVELGSLRLLALTQRLGSLWLDLDDRRRRCEFLHLLRTLRGCVTVDDVSVGQDRFVHRLGLRRRRRECRR
jgi:hypothetical protein